MANEEQLQRRPREHLSPSERQRQGGGGPLEPLERILDKGIVVDAWAEVRVLGLPLASVEARVIVASIETYLFYASAIMEMPPIARGPLAGPRAMGSTAHRAFAEEGLNPVIDQIAGGQRADTSAPQAADAPPPQLQEVQLQQRLAELERREAELSRREAALANNDNGDDTEDEEQAEQARPIQRRRPTP